MISPESGPVLFDTSAESWLTLSAEPNVKARLRGYLGLHAATVSAITVAERVRGCGLLWHRSSIEQRNRIDAARIAYLSQPSEIVAVDTTIAVVAAEIMALIPDAPTQPKRSHRLQESRPEGLARWRFDCIIAATALVAGMPLVHNHQADFEAIRVAVDRTPERFPGTGPLELIRCDLLTTARNPAS